MHRVIMGVTDPKTLIDHADRNGLNCQRSNMRIASRTQNNTNKKSNDNSTSEFLGVSLCKKSGKWKAQISVLKKVKNLGRFLIEKDAAIAYDTAAKTHHKEFANLNFK